MINEPEFVAVARLSDPNKLKFLISSRLTMRLAGNTYIFACRSVSPRMAKGEGPGQINTNCIHANAYQRVCIFLASLRLFCLYRRILKGHEIL